VVRALFGSSGDGARAAVANSAQLATAAACRSGGGPEKGEQIVGLGVRRGPSRYGQSSLNGGVRYSGTSTTLAACLTLAVVAWLATGVIMWPYRLLDGVSPVAAVVAEVTWLLLVLLVVTGASVAIGTSRKDRRDAVVARARVHGRPEGGGL